jgi:hypothetical protein
MVLMEDISCFVGDSFCQRRSHPDERSVPKNRHKIRPQGNHDSSPAFLALNGLLFEARRHSALSVLAHIHSICTRDILLNMVFTYNVIIKPIYHSSLSNDISLLCGDELSFLFFLTLILQSGDFTIHS